MIAARRPWLGRALLLLLLLASVTANAVLAWRLNDAFGDLHFARVFPLGFVPTAPQRSSSAPKRSIAFWGDSRALMWDKAPWVASMGVIDRAHGGATSTQLLYRLRTEEPVRSDYAVLQIGINDLHPLGALAMHRATIAEQLRRNLRAVLDALLARSDVVVLTTLFPPDRTPLSRRAVSDPDLLAHVAEINHLIRQAADGQHVLLLDAHALLQGSDAYLSARYVDSDFYLHVNREAYAVLNQRLEQLLEQHRSSRN
jgi:lysophospholipase L1-like esterase